MKKLKAGLVRHKEILLSSLALLVTFLSLILIAEKLPPKYLLMALILLSGLLAAASIYIVRTRRALETALDFASMSITEARVDMLLRLRQLELMDGLTNGLQNLQNLSDSLCQKTISELCETELQRLGRLRESIKISEKMQQHLTRLDEEMKTYFTSLPR